MRTITIGEKVRQAISDWYFENGIPEPVWYVSRNPSWWEEYLASLDETP